MRLAIFSDIHSNLEALQAFIDHSFKKKVNLYVCLGDVVGYGANPNSCINTLQSLQGSHFIVGNHDNAATGANHNMVKDAAAAILWTKERLTQNSLDFLKNMREKIELSNSLFCHANPCGTSDWYYIGEKSFISRTFYLTKVKTLFAGHTHVASVITRKNFLCFYIRKPEDGAVIPAASLNRQIFNCGSIGQPRDGDPRASYIIYDTDKNVVEFYRVTYNYDLAAKKILDAGLPKSLALRLAKGS
ncbi:MAG: metallophosphoesterase family protein [Desulfamplus sp.]|nr:metallophosphoesterase family protein [Desulfamplus sp.]MBF0389718.1 metallophosphoesterase family protein [Desulfamplus sp.]